MFPDFSNNLTKPKETMAKYDQTAMIKWPFIALCSSAFTTMSYFLNLAMIINSMCFIYLSGWQTPFEKEATVWYFLNSCVALITTNDSKCSILECRVLFSTVSAITSPNTELVVIRHIFRQWLSVLLISSLQIPHMPVSFILFIIRSKCSMTLSFLQRHSWKHLRFTTLHNRSGCGNVYVSLNLSHT